MSPEFDVFRGWQDLYIVPLLRPAYCIIMKHTARAKDSTIFMSKFTCLLQMLVTASVVGCLQKNKKTAIYGKCS